MVKNMKKIGVILRENGEYLTLKKEIYDVILKYKCLPVGICNEFDLDLIKFCDGFILQGGTTCNEKDLKIVSYLYDNNIPTFGICLGMQMMGLITGSDLVPIKNTNHQSTKKFVHEVNIISNTKLFNIIKYHKIVVNSRHIEQITNPKIDITAISNDNIIEGIEDKTKKFFIGVQWHPESLMDENSIKLFDEFFSVIDKL